MPVKKKTAKKNTTKKGVGLFDHIKHVNQVQDPKYFEKLSKEDKSTWNNWMVLRALSYNPNYTDIINELQKYLSISPELMYKLMIDIFPKDRGFYPFIKSKDREKYDDELVTLIKNHFEISEYEVFDYLKIFFLTDENKSELVKIISLYGKTEKEIKKLIKK